jgi:hypothetical protein
MVMDMHPGTFAYAATNLSQTGEWYEESGTGPPAIVLSAASPSVSL